ncbi:MAG: hypothetical protein MAG794_00253 [Gammaproteobacteria bacterium]|nr:hypothetical protein [Gammaproteobacteria bacterium]
METPETSKFRLVALGVGVLVLAIYPWFGESYYVGLVLRLMILGIFAMSLDLLIGYTGLVSLGHAAFFGLSGYLLAIITPDTGPISIWYALPLCLAGTGIFALVVGWLSIRTSGIYFIMITLAFAQMLFYFFNESIRFGGSDGMFLFYRPTINIGSRQLLDLEAGHNFYYFVLGALVAAYALLATLLRAPFGQVIQGIRANEARTRALGYATRRYKLVSFVIAGMVAGLAGFLEASHTGIISPGHLSWHESGTILMTVILGGMGTLYGPVLGAFTFGLLQDNFQDLTEHWILMMGFFVVAVVVFLPHGLAGLIARIGARLTSRRPAGDQP